MPREGITRISVDMTEAQRDLVERMIEEASHVASQAAGIEVTVGTRQFFHMLLKHHAEELGFQWPEDYPTAGGWRGGRQQDQNK
jgi:hypothetical protein